jgi:acyl-CoA synthetase (AMP-forming)/AMP-acid ligase II
VVLVGKSGATSEKELLEELSSFCALHLADYKRPREVRILEELPRNLLGKVQKRRILETL